MTTVATFTTPEEAHMFRTYLGAQDIEASVQGEHFVQLFWYYSNAVGGVRVMIDEADLDEASDAYRSYMKSLRTGPYPLNPVRAWPLVALLSLLTSIPLMIFGRKFRHDQKSDQSENETNP